MSIALTETFIIDASIDKVRPFIFSPENITRCMPGATMEEILDERRFKGQVKVKIGAISARYSGTITYAHNDSDTDNIEMLAEATDKGGGTVKGTITTALTALGPRQTEVRCSSSIDMTGRIISVGRGMIEGVAGEIIGQFIGNVKNELEVSSERERPEVSKEPNLLYIIFKVAVGRLGEALRRLWQRPGRKALEKT